MRKKKKTKLHHAVHIKSNTEGTSNEISFSVLDAAKKAADDAETGTSSGGLFSNFPLFTFVQKGKAVSTPTKEQPIVVGGDSEVETSPSLPAAGSAPIPRESAEVEIARRKARRKKRNRLTAFIIAVLLLTGLGAGGYFMYVEYSKHTTGISLMQQSFDTMTEADEMTLVPMDQLVNSSIDGAASSEIETVLESVEAAEQKLDNAEAFAQQANEGMRESADKEASNQAIISINARRELLAQGSFLLAEDILAKQTADVVLSAWDQVLQADMLAREAAELIANTTEENVVSSNEKTLEAKELLQLAASSYESIDTLYPGADFSVQKVYIEKRIEALDYALASNKAIEIQDKQTAEAQNEAYNNADSEAATIAEGFADTNPVQAILDKYEELTEDSREKYTQARTKAGVSDAFLRDYLGT